MGAPVVAVVTGTYNRREYLQRALASVRAQEGVEPICIVVDGGSTDGTQEALRAQEGTILIEQQGPLTGAVRAFNLGFARAVQLGAPYVMNFNDDAELVTPGTLATAIAMMERDSKIGAVAFEFDLRGPFQVEHVFGKTYPNFGLTRREAGMDVARAQGDPAGERWWNPIYHTYAADTEFGCWLWRLGWTVCDGVGLHVRDHNAQDALRAANHALGAGPGARHPDSVLFYERWHSADQLDPSLEIPVP